ncbi:EamA family transporter [Phytohabitans houttuyneae]|uniref:ABC transporter permease n=1 Tax=Phytohabitans houttuyneae TaxID=1076126 RepID=A0A6V8K2N9_9ACTN|nr:ABC transporter permease [Phytohabitans houttuyneae]
MWSLICAIAPVAWGSNYFVTHEYLPPGAPLYGAAIRALPAGLLLLVISRRLPRGAWWWRSLLLGALNVGAFFVLIYLSAQLLPTSVASTIMASSPVVMMLIAWGLLAERPRVLTAVGAAVGIAGVWLMLFRGTQAVDWRGVAASVAAMLMSSLGYVLTKKWGRDVDVLASTSWQLVAGGVLLLPFAVAFEGAPPALDAPAAWGFGYVTVVATALAFAAWFSALRRLSAATVGLVGLLNPVTGVLLGTAVAGEGLTAAQATGIALVLAGVLAGQVRRSAGTASAAGPRVSSGPPRPRWPRAASATAPAGCSPPRGS